MKERKILKKNIRKMHLADRFLFWILVLLVCHLTRALFLPVTYNEYTVAIDVVLRTTAASIFGYFISSNFAKHLSTGNKKQCDGEEADPPQNDLQVMILGSLCILTLVLLLIARDFIQLSQSVVPVISQFRDIICGCVGFLLGIPTDKN